jgi:hypothetical protein
MDFTKLTQEKQNVYYKRVKKIRTYLRKLKIIKLFK